MHLIGMGASDEPFPYIPFATPREMDRLGDMWRRCRICACCFANACVRATLYTPFSGDVVCFKCAT